jgi:hypothetical protein
MSVPTEADRAAMHAVYSSIPDTVASIASGLTSTTTAAASALQPFAGKWIYIRARGGTITVLRGASTVVAGVGLVLAPGVAYPFYVSSSTAAELRLSHISDTAGSYLDILSDSEAT